MAAETPQLASRSRPVVTWLAVLVLLVIYFALAVSAVSNKSATFDEALHLASGYSYWLFDDYRMQPENGNLPQRWAAIPLLLGEHPFPTRDQEGWYTSLDEYEPGVSGLPDQFLDADGNEGALMRGRAMIALLGVGLGLLVFVCTRQLLGTAAAFLSLTLCVFCPTVLAHGALVTSDMAAALFFNASVAAMWLTLRRVTWVTLLISSLAMGGLFVAKFSAVLMIPIGLLLIGIQLLSSQNLVVRWRGRERVLAERGQKLVADIAIALVHVIVVAVVIWGFYGFRYSMFRELTEATDPATGQTFVRDRPRSPWDQVARPDGSLVERAVQTARRWQLLPEAYLFGFAHTYHFSQDRPAFLNGRYSTNGWPQFFPYCLLFKTPLPLFALMILGTGALAWPWWGSSDDRWPGRRARMSQSLLHAAPWLVLVVVYWAFAITSRMNIGHRHIFPTYPPMFMLAGSAAGWFTWARPASVENAARLKNKASRWASAAVIGCCVLFVGESLWRWPNYLAYFNQTIGGPQYGYRHLVDSSLDWGQEMPALAEWLRAERTKSGPQQPVYLSYFGHSDPREEGIEAILLPSVGLVEQTSEPQPLRPGVYCISATTLQNLYLAFPGPWNARYEQNYQRLKANLAVFQRTASDPAARERLIAGVGGPQAVLNLFSGYEAARFARLCAHLRQREPDDQVNFAIQVYRVSAEDLPRALDGPPAELSPEVPPP